MLLLLLLLPVCVKEKLNTITTPFCLVIKNGSHARSHSRLANETCTSAQTGWLWLQATFEENPPTTSRKPQNTFASGNRIESFAVSSHFSINSKFQKINSNQCSCEIFLMNPCIFIYRDTYVQTIFSYNFLFLRQLYLIKTVRNKIIISIYISST